jgi:hypothetical protein
LCYLPIPALYRALLAAVAGVFLALWRVDSAAPFWPILGSMFMFRLIVYLFDTRHERRRPPLVQTLAYFFPLPNLCFPLFPVLDWTTFRQTYYNDEPFTIYQSGLAWIVRGLTHLVAYRLVKYYLLPAPHELTDLPHLLLFLAANYALYLRVSGWFHIATGVLHLFGFNLPRTHLNYFLAGSVTDVWRRINIYWKDFMAKVFFYPAFFALRRWGTRPALAVAGLGVFVATWLLHSYQVFWLTARLPVAASDAILWLTAGLVVLVNLQLDLNRARGEAGPAPARPGRVRREALVGAEIALRIVGTFFLVSLFWACWTLPGFPRYLTVLATGGTVTASGVLALAGGVAAVAAAGAALRLARMELRRRGTLPAAPFRLAAVAPTFVLLALVAAGFPVVGDLLGPRAAEVLATLRLELSTPVESAVAVQGYYDEIADIPVQASPLLALPGTLEKQRPPPTYPDMTRPSDPFLERELIPGWSGVVGGRRLTINNLGLRDREGLTRDKPPGVCRLAFVGSSVVMGFGVGDDETFTRLLDRGINVERPHDPPRFEVLNFGTGKSHAIHRRTLIQRKVLGFDPDAIYYVAHQDEYLGAVQHLTALVVARAELPDYLAEIVRRAGVAPETAQGEAEIRLQPFAPDILEGVYREMVADCKRHGIVAVWVYAPVPGVVELRPRPAQSRPAPRQRPGPPRPRRTPWRRISGAPRRPAALRPAVAAIAAGW